MAEIDRIVDVTITRATATPSAASFSDILIAGELLESVQSDRVASYASLTALTDAGVGTTDPIYLAASAIFSQNPKMTQVKVGRKLTGTDGSETWAVAMAAILAANSDWYGIVACTRTEADQEDIADFAEANEKLYGLSSNDSDIINGTGDIVEYLNTNNLDRSFGIYHPDADLSTDDPFAEAAIMGAIFAAYDPGEANWKFKTVSGVSAAGSTQAYPVLTSTQRTTLFEKEGNIFSRISGIDMFEQGTVGSGEYIDIIRGTDWLRARIQQLVFAFLVSADKVGFNDNGIQGVVAKLREALDEAVAIEFIEPVEEDDISAPLASEVSSTDKGNRLLPDIAFTATYTGAINKAGISGTISV